MRALQDYCSRGGTAVMVTHDLDIALNYATRVVVMSEGQVTTDLPASQVGTAVRTLEESGISLPDLVRIASALGIFLHKYSLEELAQKLKGIADEYLAVRG
jgi:energy-coupling factor transport system ATP-binding protein